LIGLANFLKHGNLVQNEQGDVKPGVFHMELSTKFEEKKSWLWQSLIFTENQTTGRIEYNLSNILMNQTGLKTARLVIRALAGVRR